MLKIIRFYFCLKLREIKIKTFLSFSLNFLNLNIDEKALKRAQKSAWGGVQWSILGNYRIYIVVNDVTIS